MSKSNIIGFVVSFVSKPFGAKRNGAEIFLRDINDRIAEYNASVVNQVMWFQSINVYCHNTPEYNKYNKTWSCDFFLETSKKTKQKFYTMTKGYKNLFTAVPNEWESIKCDIVPSNDDCTDRMNSIGEKQVHYNGRRNR